MTKAFALAGAALIALAAPCVAQEMKPAPVADLVKAVDIPYEQFTLPNGLRVVVNTDHKAPVVAVSIWYDVGSKHEPAGKTGFAHLFEHLMFGGSENNPGTYLGGLKTIGATDFNGTTYFDRTNYFETVPTPALARALYMESDRMGHLLGAIDQHVLDLQRGVVQNEKRQGDNRPYGLTQYKEVEALYGPAHPYGHTTIGSMADLDRASLADVKDWFRGHYGPNNAVLVLSGDVDLPAARSLVERYFADIPAGPKSVRPLVSVPTLPAPKHEVIKDRVGAVLLERIWTIPGRNDPDSVALQVGGGVLGGLSSSRLQRVLVREEKLAVEVNVQVSDFAQAGTFEIDTVVRPGVDPAVVSKRIDEVLADYVRTGPTADEVDRFVTTTVVARIAGLESTGGFGGKAVTLAEGALYSDDPGFYKKRLAMLAAQTPATVRTALQKWLGRPVYALDVLQGERDAYVDAGAPAKVAASPDPIVKGTRPPPPPVGEVTTLAFPRIEHARLANGMALVYAHRTAVPMTRATIAFDAGIAADADGKLGTETLVLSMLDEGTATLDGVAFAEARERLGAQIGTGATLDRTTLSLSVPSANLAPGVALFADVARNPAFADAEVARVRNQQLAGIAQELTTPEALVGRATPRLVYGTGAAYAKRFGTGDAHAVATLGRADLVAWQQAWLRPDKATVFVISDRPLGEIKAAFDRRFGDWQMAAPAGIKPAHLTATPSAPRLLLIDKPDSPQSVITMALPTMLTGVDEDRLLRLNAANDALGGSFQSRINMDLRETKHWSYGVFGYFDRALGAVPYMISAPVQADQTGPSMVALRGDMTAYLTTRPMDQAEFDRAITGAVRSLAGRFETSPAVLVQMQSDNLYRRADDYVTTLPERYRSMTLADLNSGVRAVLDPARAIWVVVGDAKVVRSQLDTFGLPVEVVPAASLADAK